MPTDPIEVALEADTTDLELALLEALAELPFQADLEQRVLSTMLRIAGADERLKHLPAADVSWLVQLTCRVTVVEAANRQREQDGFSAGVPRMRGARRVPAEPGVDMSRPGDHGLLS